MKPSPAFQFYPQDFLVGTADLTAEEVGGYIRLLCYQWAKGSLPNDDRKLMQLSGISDGLSLGNVSVKFRLCSDNLRRNDRLESVRLEQEEYRKKQAENGSKGGNPNFKHGKHNPYYKPKDNPLDNPKINPSSSPSSSPISLKKEEAFELPLNLQTETFKTKWDEWLLHRKEIGSKVSPSTARKQLKTLSGWGEIKACQSIDTAIEKGWVGFFEPKSRIFNGSNTSQTVRKLPEGEGIQNGN